ncbi:MAG: tetratricopeptide repeat protein [Acidobacteriota bacterium]
MAQSVAARSFLGTCILVVVSIGVLFVVDTFLARTESMESRVEAARRFSEGQNFLHEGNNAGAIERLKDAIEIERQNRYYQRTLGQAQLAAGKLADAEATLNALLASDSTDGPANLIMARVQVKEGQFPEAISYFHRAIYGQWPDDAAAYRLHVRFELIDLLAQRDSKEELLAELLPVEDQAPRDIAARERMGRLLLQAGSPVRSGNVFRGILQEAPANAGAYAGLGDAEFAQGNYRTAQRDFQNALRLAPDDAAIRKRLDLCNDLLTLDPTVRGLDSAERLNRSRKLLTLTADDATQCAGNNPTPEMRVLLDAAAKVLKARRHGRPSADAESNLDLAEQIWQARGKDCKRPAKDSPMSLVLDRLAR